MTSHLVVRGPRPGAARHPEPDGAGAAPRAARLRRRRRDRRPRHGRRLRRPRHPRGRRAVPARRRRPALPRRRQGRRRWCARSRRPWSPSVPGGSPRSGSLDAADRVTGLPRPWPAGATPARRAEASGRRTSGGLGRGLAPPTCAGAVVVAVDTPGHHRRRRRAVGAGSRPRAPRPGPTRSPASPRAGRSSSRSATPTGGPRSGRCSTTLAATGRVAVVVEWGWPGPYDGRPAQDLHARRLASRAGRP